MGTRTPALQQVDEARRGELAALIGVENLRRSVAGQRFLQGHTILPVSYSVICNQLHPD